MSGIKEKNRAIFSKLTSSSEIVDFLHVQAQNHRGFFHYTTLDACKGILRNKRLHLSIGRKMNDLMEPQKGNPERWKASYIASFSWSSTENVAMWGLYGNPLSQAVRIRFPKCEMLTWLENIQQQKLNAYHPQWNGKAFDYYPIDAECRIRLTDVAYYHGSSLEWNRAFLRADTCPHVATCTQQNEFTGCVKNSAWYYENEVRIIVEFSEPLKNIDTVALDITLLVDKVEITCSPCLQMAKASQELMGFPIKLKASNYHGYLKLKLHCTHCIYYDQKQDIPVNQCPCFEHF